MKHISAIKYLSMPDTNAHEFLFLSQYFYDKCRNKSNRNAQMLVQIPSIILMVFHSVHRLCLSHSFNRLN